MKLSKDFNLTKNFRINEFLSDNDSGEISIEDYININQMALKLQELRNVVGSINVNSGYRSESYNKKIGGSLNSYHLKGLAVDIKFDWSHWNVESLLDIINYLGFGNAGFYVRNGNMVWIHLDVGKPWLGGWTKFTDSLSYKEYEV